MDCSLQLHPQRYQLTCMQRLAMPLVSTYALRHFQLANTESSCCRCWGHRIIGVIELIPIVGLFASLIERIIQLVRDCLFPKQPPFDLDMPPNVQALILDYLTEEEFDDLKKINEDRKEQTNIGAALRTVESSRQAWRDAFKLIPTNHWCLHGDTNESYTEAEQVQRFEKLKTAISKLRPADLHWTMALGYGMSYDGQITLLMHVILHLHHDERRREIVALLLKKGANPGQCTEEYYDRFDAIEFAKRTKDEVLVGMLEEALKLPEYRVYVSKENFIYVPVEEAPV